MEISTSGAKPAKRLVVQIAGQDVPDFPAFLEGFDTGKLFVRAERQIPEDASVTVSLDEVQLPAIVATCQPQKSGWLLSLVLLSGKRRLLEVVPHSLEGVIGVVDGSGSELRPCSVMNSSSYGLGLRLGFPVRPGTQVCVEINSMLVLGEMRHCHAKPDGTCIAGLVIIDVATDARRESAFSVMLNNLRWKLASSLRGKDVSVHRSER